MATGVLERQLAKSLDLRLSVFRTKIQNDTLDKATELPVLVYLISEVVRPCCCMLCNKQKLAEMLALTQVCAGKTALIEELATLVYHDLARCNGLG